MADKMMRIAGRSPAGLAKNISLDDGGGLITAPAGNLQRILASGPLAAKSGETNGSRTTDLIWLGTEEILLYVITNTSSAIKLTQFPVKIDYYTPDSATLLATDVMTSANHLILTNGKWRFKFRPRCPWGKITIENTTANARTCYFDMIKPRLNIVTISDTRLRRNTRVIETGVSISVTQASGLTPLFASHYTIGDNVTSWGLYFMSYGRSLSNCLDFLKIRVEFTNNEFNDSPGGYITFRQDFGLSQTNEFNKALAVDSKDSAFGGTADRVSIMLSGKYVNVPIGSMMRIYLFSTRDDASLGVMTFNCGAFSLVEEGVF